MLFCYLKDTILFCYSLHWFISADNRENIEETCANLSPRRTNHHHHIRRWAIHWFSPLSLPPSLYASSPVTWRWKLIAVVSPMTRWFVCGVRESGEQRLVIHRLHRTSFSSSSSPSFQRTVSNIDQKTHVSIHLLVYSSLSSFLTRTQWA